jgi:hypothetical protein
VSASFVLIFFLLGKFAQVVYHIEVLRSAILSRKHGVWDLKLPGAFALWQESRLLQHRREIAA